MMDRLKSAVANATRQVGHTTFIAIDGWGASGKTTLASEIADVFDAGIVHLDDLSQQTPFSWVPRLREWVIEPIRRGASTLSYPKASWWGHTQAPMMDQPVTPTMVVEGVGCLSEAVRSLWGVTILVETPRRICLERGVERDLASGTPRAEIVRQWLEWQAEEARYFEADDLPGYADFVVDGTLPFAPQLSSTSVP